jgi:hypothetical protein
VYKAIIGFTGSCAELNSQWRNNESRMSPDAFSDGDLKRL